VIVAEESSRVRQGVSGLRPVRPGRRAAGNPGGSEARDPRPAPGSPAPWWRAWRPGTA